MFLTWPVLLFFVGLEFRAGTIAFGVAHRRHSHTGTGGARCCAGVTDRPGPDWPLERVVLLGFVSSLSSTAVIIKLAAVGLTAGIISETANQYTIAVIALSLPVSPFWIQAARGYFWSQALP